MMSRSFFWKEQELWSFLNKDEKTREDEKTFRGQEVKIEGPNFEGLSGTCWNHDTPTHSSSCQSLPALITKMWRCQLAAPVQRANDRKT